MFGREIAAVVFGFLTPSLSSVEVSVSPFLCVFCLQVGAVFRALLRGGVVPDVPDASFLHPSFVLFSESFYIALFLCVGNFCDLGFLLLLLLLLPHLPSSVAAVRLHVVADVFSSLGSPSGACLRWFLFFISLSGVVPEL